jgi:hypothetical protein
VLLVKQQTAQSQNSADERGSHVALVILGPDGLLDELGMPVTRLMNSRLGHDVHTDHLHLIPLTHRSNYPLQ